MLQHNAVHAYLFLLFAGAQDALDGGASGGWGDQEHRTFLQLYNQLASQQQQISVAAQAPTSTPASAPYTISPSPIKPPGAVSTADGGSGVVRLPARRVELLADRCMARVPVVTFQQVIDHYEWYVLNMLTSTAVANG